MADNKLNGYELSRNWFDWAFENPSKISPAHGILYFFCIEHCNRMGWKKEFGLPTTMAKEAIGIRSYNTYINTLNDLIDWGFIILVEKSKNQFSSNIIAISNFNKALDKALNKALDKASIKHTTKQLQSTGESISSIIKQDNNKHLNKETVEERQQIFYNDIQKYSNKYSQELLESFYYYWSAATQDDEPKMKKELLETWSTGGRLATWFKKEPEFNKQTISKNEQRFNKFQEASDGAAAIIRAKYGIEEDS